MKSHAIILSGLILLSLGCSSTNKETNTTSVDQNTESTAMNPRQDEGEEKDVMYYFEKYADVDSEDPSIGVGPLVIVSKDLEKGIIRYQFKEAFNGENPIQTIQLWHMNGFDYIDYPGGYILIDGEKEYPIFVVEEPMELAMKVIDKRTARGGECDYAESPDIKVRNNQICVVLTCSDNPNFSETIGTITLKNGKLTITEI